MANKYLQEDIATYAGLKGYKKYFQKGGQWYGRTAEGWQAAVGREEARGLAGLGVTPTPTPTPPELEPIEAGVASVAERTRQLAERVRGITPGAAAIGAYEPLVDAGRDLQTWYGAAEGAPKTETDIKARYRELGGEATMGAWTGSKEQYTWQLQQEKAKPIAPPAPREIPYEPAGVEGGITTGGQVNVTTPNVQMETTDLADIMTEINLGELQIPELEIAGEQRDIALQQLEQSATQSLSKMQQQLAKQGMTFSGIRTRYEANLAAEVLSRETGINLEMSGRIIAAARNEQARRERAIQAQQNAAQSALRAQGYIMNPFTGTLEKTLERERFEFGVLEAMQPAAPPRPQIFGTQATGYYEQYYDEATGRWETRPTGIQVAPPTVTGVEPITYSGKYTEDYLAVRANDYITEEGGIDWLAVDKLENVDKNLYNDMVVFLNNALKMTATTVEPETVTPPPEEKPKGVGIARLAEKMYTRDPIKAWKTMIDNIKWLFE